MRDVAKSAVEAVDANQSPTCLEEAVDFLRTESLQKLVIRQDGIHDVPGGTGEKMLTLWSVLQALDELEFGNLARKLVAVEKRPGSQLKLAYARVLTLMRGKKDTLLRNHL